MTLRTLQAHAVHVYLWQIGACSESTLCTLGRVLSPAEQQQNASFGHQKIRDRHTFCRGVLRWQLASLLNEDAGSIEIITSDNGKPTLANSNANLFFNYSHSGDYVAMAFTHAHEVGVDLEYTRRERRFASIANHFFCAAEAQDVLALEGPQRKQRFYEYWTLKEAYLKARGEGIFSGLNTVGFDLGSKDGQPIKLLESSQPAINEWYFFSTIALPDYQLALAAPSASPLQVAIYTGDLKQLDAIRSA